MRNKFLRAGMGCLLGPLIMFCAQDAYGDHVERSLQTLTRGELVTEELDRFEARPAKARDAGVEKGKADAGGVFLFREESSSSVPGPVDQEAWLEEMGGKAKARAVKNALNQIEIGMEVYSYRYREPGLMKDTGWLYGFFGSYTRRLKDNSDIKTLRDAWEDPVKATLFKIDGRMALGQVDYESNGTGTLDDEKYYSFELRGVMGYEFPFAPGTRVTPFFGVGGRYLLDDSGGRTTSTGNWTYDRESRYFYLPVGFELARQLENNWSLTLTCEYDFFIEGKQKSHLEDGGLTLHSAVDGQWHTPDTLENDQDEGYGMRGALRLLKAMDRWNFYVEPFVRYWNIKHSQLGQETSESGTTLWYYDEAHQYPIYLYEPDNNTTEYGVRVGLQY